MLGDRTASEDSLEGSRGRSLEGLGVLRSRV